MITKDICAFSTSDDKYAVKAAMSMLTLRRWRPELKLFLIGKYYSPETKKFLKKYRITPIEKNYDKYFHTSWGNYPLECYYMFVGPEILHKKGFKYSLYVDGDVFCNQDPLQFPLSEIKDFAGALTKRSIRDIFDYTGEKDAETVVQMYGNEEVLKEPRVQTGIVFFNNQSLVKKDFLKKIGKVYQDAIDAGIPRKGDDSLLALFRVAYPKWGYADTGHRYNFITFHRGFGRRWTRLDEEMISNGVFWHFNKIKPWDNGSQFATYAYEYFYHAWRRHVIDTLEPHELELYFPAIHATLSDEHLRFYWYHPTKNVGDLITPYFLKKVCGVKQLSEYSISEKAITEIEREQISKDIRSRVKRIRRKLQKRSHNVPHKQAHYAVSTGSVVRLCGDHAMVYGSGIRSHDQEVHRSLIRAVRGPLTRQRYLDSGFPCPPIYGDPGLLMPKYYFPKKKKQYSVGVIPHFTEYKQIAKQYKDEKDVVVIDMGCGDLEKVIDQILECKVTLSSSLHGLILSHAYGVPTRQVEYSDNINGDGTKFLDYYSSIPIKRIPPVNAAGFAFLPLEKLTQLKYEQPLPIDTSRLESAMFFDKNGFRKSARYPYA